MAMAPKSSGATKRASKIVTANRKACLKRRSEPLHKTARIERSLRRPETAFNVSELIYVASNAVMLCFRTANYADGMLSCFDG